MFLALNFVCVLLALKSQFNSWEQRQNRFLVERLFSYPTDTGINRLQPAVRVTIFGKIRSGVDCAREPLQLAGTFKQVRALTLDRNQLTVVFILCCFYPAIGLPLNQAPLNGLRFAAFTPEELNAPYVACTKVVLPIVTTRWPSMKFIFLKKAMRG